MPMYDFVCPHGHRFEKVVPMDDRDKPVKCEGLVHQLVTDVELPPPAARFLLGDPGVAFDVRSEWKPPEGVRIEKLGPLEDGGGQIEVLVRDIPCILMAKRVEISVSHPETLLSYGLGANRDAANEGRYDPLTPSKRGIRRHGRGG
jgi:putative FmdB family regulatory protein